MFNCFKCNQTFSTIQILCKHIKYLHGWLPSEVLVCNQGGCHQKFSHLDRYKRHLANIHKNIINSASEPPKANNCTNLDTTKSKITIDDQVNTICDEITLGAQQKSSHCQNKQINELKRTIESSSLKFVAKLYSMQLLPTSVALEIIQSAQELISVIISSIRTCKKICSEENLHVDNLLDFCELPFINIKSEYLLLKELRKKGLYSAPKKFTVFNQNLEQVKQGKLVIDEFKSEGILMPISAQIKTFFGTKDLLKKTLSHGKELLKNKNVLTNFIQGELWQEKISIINKENVIPLFLYYDDFETNNPLGSRSGKQAMAAFYYMFPTIPQDLSKLSNIFVAMLVKSKILKTFNYNKTLAPLVDELKLLETQGIDIKTEDGFIKVHFVLGLVIGDNLGLNSILGFSQSFSHNFFCRFCTMKKEETQACLVENLSLARQKECYNEQVLNIDTESFKNTGIKDNCILNKIDTFHVTENYSVDIMHDVMEGIIKFGISNCLHSFIFEKQYFSIETLNNRIQNFEYGETQLSNRPGSFKVDHIKQKKLQVTAREALCLLEYILFYIGDLIPPSNRLLKYLHTLQNLVEIVFKESFSNYDIICLKELIKKHNKLYIEYFNENLKPKHHNLLHYPTIIKKSGPLKPMWCMRFESKHRELKYYTNAITSRKNLPLSIAKKCAIRFTFNVLNEMDIKSDVSILKLSASAAIDLNAFPYNELIKQIEIQLEEVTLAEIIEYRGTKYKIKDLLKSENPYTVVFKIDHIIIYRDKVILCIEKMKIEKTNNHYNCYVLGDSLKQYCCLELNPMENKHPITTNKIPRDKIGFKYPII